MRRVLFVLPEFIPPLALAYARLYIVTNNKEEVMKYTIITATFEWEGKTYHPTYCQGQLFFPDIEITARHLRVLSQQFRAKCYEAIDSTDAVTHTVEIPS